VSGNRLINGRLRQVGIVAIIVFSAIQIIRPHYDAPKSDPQRSFAADRSVPNDVKTIVDRACYDCHSNRTDWPWYSQIAPVSWILSRHVRRGRLKLNFSEWIAPEQAPKQNLQLKKVEAPQICDSVQNGSMPLRSYRLMHGNALLSATDVQTICNWAKRSQTATQLRSAN
jgi:hypothetical protein